METRTFYASALKAGERFQVCISAIATRDLQIRRGDQLEITVRKTGIKARTRPDSRYPQSTKAETEPGSTPVVKTPEIPSVEPVKETLDPEFKAQILTRLQKESATLVIAQASAHPDYDREEIMADPDIKKAVEAQ